MPVVNVHILYVGTSAYDLRKVSSEVPHPTDPLLVLVRFQDEPRLTVTFNKATFDAAWQASLNASSGGAVPIGPASGDLGGVYPGPDVVGLRGVPITAGAPAAGDQYIYDAVTGEWVLSSPTRYFANSAAAVAAAAITPFINGTFVVLYPGTPTSEAGTYQVTANGGIAFPADYTLVSNATDTASEVSVLDAAGYFQPPKDVENVLAQLAGGTVTSPATGALAVGTNYLDTIAITACDGGQWFVVVENGVLRYTTTLSVTHDGAVASVEESGSAAGPGVGVLPITFDADINLGILRIIATASLPGWSFRARRMAALVV